jgi:hypothetical protein
MGTSCRQDSPFSAFRTPMISTSGCTFPRRNWRAWAGVKVGDSASLTIDGVEGEVTAVVESISRQGEFTPANLQTPDERGKQVFPVRLRLKKPDPRVKPGMYASIRSLGTVR